MKNINTLLVFVVVTLFLSAGVFAFFLFEYDNISVYQVRGANQTLLILVDLINLTTMNVNESLTNVQELKIVNQGISKNMTYTLLTNITNLSPGNCNATGDMSFEFKKSDFQGVINSSNDFTMFSGTNTFNFTVTAINDLVCPQDIEAQINLNLV